MKSSMRFLAGALVLGMCAFVAGCGDSQSAKPQGQVTEKIMQSPSKQAIAPLNEIKEGRKNVYAILKVIKGSYWGEVVKGLKEGGDAANVNVYMGGVLKDGNWEMQRDMIKELQGKKVDAVILGVADSTNMTAVAKELRAKKIPVILVDTGLNSKDYDAAFMTNNVEAGAKAAEKMLAMLKQNGVKENEEIVVKLHVSNLASRTISERLESAASYWKDHAPKSWKLGSEYLVNYGDKDRAKKLAEDILKKDKKVRGILSLNNSTTGATVDALMTNNRKDVVVVGFDMNPFTAKGIENPDYKVATILQNQHKMGEEAVKAALAAAEGKQAAVKDVDTGITVVDDKNFKK